MKSCFVWRVRNNDPDSKLNSMTKIRHIAEISLNKKYVFTSSYEYRFENGYRAPSKPINSGRNGFNANWKMTHVTFWFASIFAFFFSKEKNILNMGIQLPTSEKKHDQEKDLTVFGCLCMWPSICSLPKSLNAVVCFSLVWFWNCKQFCKIAFCA